MTLPAEKKFYLDRFRNFSLGAALEISNGRYGEEKFLTDLKTEMDEVAEPINCGEELLHIKGVQESVLGQPVGHSLRNRA